MSIFITLIAALIVFSAVIAIHEFGHFAVAKLCGIQVNEFSIGMGPALWKKIYKGTQYSLRALPVGGYVALEGEESPESQQAEAARDEREAETASPIPPEQRTGIPLNDAPVWQRALVMAAGAFMNFVLGFVVLVILVAAQEGPITSRVIYSIEGSALCGQTGLQAGDEIVAVNGRRCFVANDILYELVRTEQYRARFTVKRDGQKVELPDVQFDTWQDEDGQTHMSLGFTVYGIPKTPLHVLSEAWNSTLYYGHIAFTSLTDLVRGRESINNLSGPVGIVNTMSQVGSQSPTAADAARSLLDLAALIAVNLAVMNLLPLPALDGGRIFFLLLNGVLFALFRKKIPAKYEGYVHMIGMAGLLALSLVVTFSDIGKLFGI